MKHNVNTNDVKNTEPFSIKELILGLKDIYSLLLRKWILIASIAIIGAVLGGLYASSKKPIYGADCIFVLDESGASGGSGGELAILGLGKSNAGLFNATDNIIWLYSSNLMLKKTLLTTVKKGDKDIVLIEWFLDSTKLRKTINLNKILKKIHFSVGDQFDSLSIEQNSILGACIGLFKSKYLKVQAIDKTENIITVNTSAPDEMLAKVLNDNLVKTVNNYYIETKTQKAAKEVHVLQLKADSFRTKLNQSMYQVASASDNVPYANPNQQILRVAPQKKATDVELESAIYIEIMKSLEASKINLEKERPLIKVVDAPSLPLDAKSFPLSKGIILGLIVFSFLIISFLVIRLWIVNIMKS